MSSPPTVANLYWHPRTTIAASVWRRGGADARLNNEPVFFTHMDSSFALCFLSSVYLSVFFVVADVRM
jgi:hypothetical protein